MDAPGKTKDLLQSVPKVELPKGGGAIRSIGEKFQANPATGTASFSVPVALSPGRNGVSPGLTLSYDSGAGNGPFGMGWSLSIPSIKRKTDKGLPEYYDAKDSDTFVLSDAEDLVPYRVFASGTWSDKTSSWLDGDGVTWAIRWYRPRTETAFARIERWTHPTTKSVHWRTISRENVTRIYGLSTSARLADPDNASRVFQWLLEEERDEVGNVTTYVYDGRERDATVVAINEKNRGTSGNGAAYTYLKRVYYGNVAPFSADDGFYFEVVFDYGDHTTDPPVRDVNAVPGTCPARLDAYSNYRARFDVRCSRLCQRVLVFHRFPGGADGDSTLVRATELTYAPSAIASTLTSITVRGYRTDDGVVTDTVMPTLEFGYSAATIDSSVQYVEGIAVRGLTLDMSQLQWVDLDAEGMAGLLSEQGGGWWYMRNEGMGRLGPASQLSTRPNVALSTATTRLMDVDGDGRLEVVTMQSGVAGTYARTKQKGWDNFRYFKSLPNINWNDPNIRYIDLDGDGIADLLICGDMVFTWHQSKGVDGWEGGRQFPKNRDEEKGPTAIYENDQESILLADMTGDGLTDLVRIRAGSICYWPNRGYGRFGAKVQMKNSPRFDGWGFDPRRVRLADIDGSGPADVIYLGPKSVRYWFNQAGNSWSTENALSQFPGVENTAKITVSDLLGNGTQCIVWASPLQGDSYAPMRYIELMADGKPFLLTSVTNNLGHTTRLTYAPSTQFYSDDRRALTPWATRLPFPVQCLKEVEQRDHVTGWKLVQTFAYHHGYQDTDEREFRGFAFVEQRDTETFADFEEPDLANADIITHRPPKLTKTWFHVGAWRRDQPDLDAAMAKEIFADASAMTPQVHQYASAATGWASMTGIEARESRRVLRGKVLRQEIYAEDGPPLEALPYQVTANTYTVTRLQAVNGDAHAAFRVDARETVTWHYERATDAPRVEHSLVLATDVYGNVTQSASATYPRRSGSSAAQETTGVLIVTDASFAYDVGAVESGPGESEHWHPGVAARTTTWHTTGVTVSEASPLTVSGLTTSLSAASEIDWDVAPTTGVQKRRIGDQLTAYFNDAVDAELADATIGVRALVYAKYARAFTAAELTSTDSLGDIGPSSTAMENAGYVQHGTDTGWWANAGTRTLDSATFYLATAYIDPFGNSTGIAWDATSLFVASVTDALSNVIAADYDYTALQPNLVTDPNGNRTAASYDALGRLIAVAVEGKEGGSDGDTLADPTTTYAYELSRWVTDGKPMRVHVRTRETHADSGTRWYDRYTYSDGGGNVIQEKVNAEPGTAYEVVDDVLTAVDADPRWVGTGRTVLDNKGSPVKQYEPFFSTTEEYDDEKDLVEWGVSPTISYDPVGRATQVKLPNGTLRKIEFDPWSQTSWDENDSVNDADCTASSTLKGLAIGADTPTVVRLDVQGRVYATEEMLVAASGGTPATVYTTTLTLDVLGNVTAVTAQRESSNTSPVVTDYAIETRSFDMLGRPMKITSADGGVTVALLDVAGQPQTLKLGSTVTRVHAYDVLRREVSRTVTDGDGTRVTDVFEYGEDATDPATSNLLGNPWRTWHKGGRDEHTSYDFKGNLLSTTRRYWDRDGTSTDTADWTTLDDTNLESDTDLWLTTSQTYDALNRVTSQTAPDETLTAFTYNEAGLFESTTVGSDTYVSGVSYNARGQRESIDYGPASAVAFTTTYTYEPDTFRLSTLFTSRTSDSKTLQDLTYTYDPVGNIREIVNAADDTVYFDNVAVSPDQACTYDAFYRLKTATGREKVSRGQPYNGDPAAGTLRDSYLAVALYEERYAYDAVGNMTEMRHITSGPTVWVRTYTYEEDGSDSPVSNRLVDTTESVGTVTYQHDDRGNIVFFPHLYPDGATPPSANAFYDDRGQMVKVLLNATNYAVYYYSDTGERVRKVVVKGAITEDRRYAGGFEVWRKITSGSLTEERTTLHVMDGEKRIAMIETRTTGTPTTRVRFQLGNHLGTSVLEVNETGAVISYEEYHPYGSTAWWTNDGDAEVSQKRYRYTGMERDDETGLQCHGVRYYAVWLGRWMSADPIGLGDGVNRYAYCLGGPVGQRDVGGMRTGEDGGPEANPPQDEPIPDWEPPVQIQEQSLGGGQQFDGPGVAYDPEKLPPGSDVTPWSRKEVMSLLGEDGRQLLRQALSRGAKIETYGTATAVWTREDKSTYSEDVTSLNPGEIMEGKNEAHPLRGAVIMVPRGVSSADAVGIIIHELTHPKVPDSLGVVGEETEVRSRTETFMLTHNLPESEVAGVGNLHLSYRVQDPATGMWHINAFAIAESVRSNPYYSSRDPSSGPKTGPTFTGLDYSATKTVWGRF